jgi:5-methylthioadenosine/S-adenosylhomocysteine deaminase
VDLLVRGALLGDRSVDVSVRDGRIQRIVPTTAVRRGTPAAAASATPDPTIDPTIDARATRVLDARGLHLVPSFTNGHTHAAMTLFRGWGDDLPLMTWLEERIWPAEARMTAEDVYHGTRLAILEMIRSGTTRFNDMYWHAPAIARAAEELGVRAVIGAAFVDLGQPPVAALWRGEVEAWLEQRSEWGPRVRAAIAPHAIYTVSTENLRWLGDLAESHDLPFHIHLSETRVEVENCLAMHGMRPARLLNRLGLVGERLLAAHGVHLDQDEMALLGAAGASVVTNPAANLKLAVGGIFDYAAARRADVRVLIGTDGAASNNSLDLFEEVKLFALLQKHRSRDPTTLPASEALAAPTTSAAEVFDRHDASATGRVAVGEPADFLLLDLSGPATQPGHDVASDLVYAANGGVVHTTVCDGRILMHDRILEIADEAEIVAKAAETARRITASA